MRSSSVQQKVVAIGDLTRPELVELWVKQYGCPPPFGVRQPLLARAAAWHLQEKRIGGLSPNAKRLLKAALKRVEASLDGNGHETDMITVPPAATESIGRKQTTAGGDGGSGPYPLPLPGARLIREWNGRRYIVEVVDSGFVMDGKPYRSLTAIAFRITGARWSGPRFFGL